MGCQAALLATRSGRHLTYWMAIYRLLAIALLAIGLHPIKISKFHWATEC